MKDLIIFTTTQTHSLGAKAGLILGLKVKTLEVRFEDKLSLRGATLRGALEEDISSGIHPFLMSKHLVPLTLDAGTLSSFFYTVTTIGTTSSGANDNMKEIRAVGAPFLVKSLVFSSR